MMYIGDYLGRREIYSPDKLAIVDAGKQPELRFTYREWNQRVNRLANWLQDTAGISKADRVAILARDGIEHLDCIYACGKLGAIHTALNWRLHWRELVSLIEDTTPQVLIYSDDFKASVQEIEAATNGTELEIGQYLHIEGEGIPGSFHYETTVQSASDDPVTCETLEAEDIEGRPVWKPMHLQPVFSGCRVVGGKVSGELFETGLCLPSGSSMGRCDLDRVIRVVHEARRTHAKP